MSFRFLRPTPNYYETKKKTRLLSQQKIRSDFERKVLSPEIHSTEAGDVIS